MSWVNEVTFEIDGSNDSFDEFETLSKVTGIIRNQVTVKMIWAVKNGNLKALRKTVICRGTHHYIVDAGRQAFEDLLNGKPYDLTMEVYSIDCPNYKTLPWVLKIDHLPEAIQELIRQLFSTDKLREMKMLTM